MLLLGRKVGESIVIGRDVIVTVTAIDRGYVKLGITAPPEVAVHREEISQRIAEEERRRAAQP